jgi:hypothetical protein
MNILLDQIDEKNKLSENVLDFFIILTAILLSFSCYLRLFLCWKMTGRVEPCQETQ